MKSSTPSRRLGLPGLGKVFAGLSVLGFGTLCFLSGAAAVLLRLPPAEFLEKAVKGARALHERKQIPERAPLTWDGVGNDVRVDKPAHTSDGFTLITTTLGARAQLIDMRGNVVHSWALPFRAAWPRPDHVSAPLPEEHIYWFGCHAFANGDLLAVYHGDGDTPYGYGLAKLDKDSKLLWAYAGNVHHNIDVADDGTIYAVTQKLAATAPRDLDFVGTPHIADKLVVLSAAGQELKSVPILEAFRDSPYALTLALVGNVMTREEQIQARYFPKTPLGGLDWDKVSPADKPGAAPAMRRTPLLGKVGTPAEFSAQGDYLHVNSVKVLSAALAAKFPMFKPGQVLISLRSLDALAVVDVERRSVAWAARGLWRRQHTADFLGNGRLILYDNVGSTAQTRVLEYDPATQAVPWSYANENSKPFLAPLMGATQRLWNGNTLIVDPDGFRIFEITPGKELVWEIVLGKPESANTAQSVTATAKGLISAARRYPSDELSFLKGLARVRP